ncbi:MAG: hydrogenase expression/formation protein HypE [Immundisolibacter sp.]|uniref:hydrogenase expression/formation protein HypE n=1 Tax=Immundisolibacter sp. TaxID=1934948 RepID=UPI003EE1D358
MDLPVCPLPLDDSPTVLLAHGGGGRLMHQLLDTLILPTLGMDGGRSLHDAALLDELCSDAPPGRLAFTTDSYVVRPLFFPGGDIGTLAVCGTVNDLAMAGAQPRALSVSLILEEGLPMDTLWRVLLSLRQSADAIGVRIVTGDTKVVERGRGDGLYLNTAGVGVAPAGVDICPGRVRTGDAVLVSGDLGRHGIAVMAQREGIAFETVIESDCAALAGTVTALLEAGIEVHCLRDLTRGGLASALVEIARAAGVDLHVDEAAVPVSTAVAAACELLGFDPLHVACEGRLVAFVPAAQAQLAHQVLRRCPGGGQAALIGSVSAAGGKAGRVTLRGPYGIDRPLDLPAGELLPRIC